MARSNTDLILEILRWQLVAENSRIGNIIDPKERLARRQETAIAWHVIRQKEPNPSELTRLIERFVGTDEMMRCGVEFPALRTLNLNQLAEDITIIFDSPDSLQQPDGDGAVRADPDSGIDSEGVDVLQESFLDGTERPQRVRRAIPFRLSLLDGDHTPDESVTSVSPDANYQRVSIPIPATPTRTPEPANLTNLRAGRVSTPRLGFRLTQTQPQPNVLYR